MLLLLALAFQLPRRQLDDPGGGGGGNGNGDGRSMASKFEEFIAGIGTEWLLPSSTTAAERRELHGWSRERGLLHFGRAAWPGHGNHGRRQRDRSRRRIGHEGRRRVQAAYGAEPPG